MEKCGVTSHCLYRDSTLKDSTTKFQPIGIIQVLNVEGLRRM